MVLSPRSMRQQLAAAATQLRLIGGKRRPQRVRAVVLTALASASAESRTPRKRAILWILSQRGSSTALPHMRKAGISLPCRDRASAADCRGRPPLPLRAAVQSRSSDATHPTDVSSDLVSARRKGRLRMR